MTALLPVGPVSSFTIDHTPQTQAKDIPPGRYQLLKLLDLDAHFRNSPNSILLDKIDFSRQGYSEDLNKKLYSQGSELNFIASCDCGHLEDNFYIGMTCPLCKSVVASPLSADRGHLPHTTWLSIPDEIPGVLHPVFYTTLTRWLRYGKKKNYIDTILNPDEDLPPELSGVIHGRGFKYFHDNFDEIMTFFMGFLKKPSIEKARAKAEEIQRFINKYRSVAFIRYMPALSNVLHPITAADSSETSRRYADKGSQYILQAAHTLSFLRYFPQKSRRPGQFDAKVFSAYKSWVTYFTDITARRLNGKPSLLRRHMFGARFHWSYRGVIVPITGAHSYDELHIPWSVGVRLLKVHLMGRLVRKHDYAIGEAAELLAISESKYDPLIHRLMDELIQESSWTTSDGKHRGLASIFNRNPSIQPGALQLFLITRVKPDIYDKTIGMSVLTLNRMNADFDKIPNVA